MIYDAHNHASYKLYEWLASSDHVMEIRVNDSILKIQLLTLTDHNCMLDKQTGVLELQG